MGNLYGGYIAREFFDSMDQMSEIQSEKRVCVEAPSRGSAELIIHEVYGRNEEKYTRRTSKNAPGDKVSVRDLKEIKELTIDCVLENF